MQVSPNTWRHIEGSGPSVEVVASPAWYTALPCFQELTWGRELLEASRVPRPETNYVCTHVLFSWSGSPSRSQSFMACNSLECMCVHVVCVCSLCVWRQCGRSLAVWKVSVRMCACCVWETKWGCP